MLKSKQSKRRGRELATPHNPGLNRTDTALARGPAG
jgi:hypothetical protein